MTLLSIEGLSVSHGAVQALTGVDLDVEAGAITAVLGANGAGKTTLLRTINGLLRPRAGSIRFDGRDLTALSPEDVVRLGVAHVPDCLLYTSPSPRDQRGSRMPSSA